MRSGCENMIPYSFFGQLMISQRIVDLGSLHSMKVCAIVPDPDLVSRSLVPYLKSKLNNPRLFFHKRLSQTIRYGTW